MQKQHSPTADTAARQTHLPQPIIITFAHLDPLALGVAIGFVIGLWLLSATLILVIKGGAVIGPNLSLLSQFLVGYSVTWSGSIVGFLYGACAGFIFGFLFAWLRNFLNHIYLTIIRRRAERQAVGDLL